MFDEDGSLDPTLKFLLYTVLALAAGKMLWEWLTEDVSRWITGDLWGLITDHPWWSGLIVVGGVVLLVLLGKLVLFLFGPAPIPMTARTTRSSRRLTMRPTRTC